MARIIIGVAMIAVGLFVPWASPMVGALLMGMIMTGASMVIGGVAQKLMGKHSQAIGIVVRQAAAPWNVVYGRSRLGGVMTYGHNTWDDNKLFRCVVAHVGHTINEYLGFYLDGRKLYFNIQAGDTKNGAGQTYDRDLVDFEGNHYNFKRTSTLTSATGGPGNHSGLRNISGCPVQPSVGWAGIFIPHHGIDEHRLFRLC